MPRCLTCPRTLRKQYKGVSYDRCFHCRQREYQAAWVRKKRGPRKPRARAADDLSPAEIERVYQAALAEIRARRAA